MSVVPVYGKPRCPEPQGGLCPVLEHPPLPGLVPDEGANGCCLCLLLAPTSLHWPDVPGSEGGKYPWLPHCYFM